MLLLNRDLVDPVLSLQLDDLHLAIESEITELAPQATVEQLVEVNVTVVAADAHFKHYFLHLVIGSVSRQTQRHWELSEEVIELFLAQF